MHAPDDLTRSMIRFFQQLTVFDCGFTKVRIGNDNDGGYVLFKELCGRTKVLYSFGVGDDVGFEMDFVNRFPLEKVHLFDPTIDSLPEGHPTFEFHKFGFGQKAQGPIMVSETDSVLKVDVEWGEWEGIDSAHSSALSKFAQMVIEFHLVHVDQTSRELTPYFQGLYQSVIDQINVSMFNTYYDVMHKLNSLFYIFHIHVNNSLPLVELAGISFPPLVELSFVRKDLIFEAKKTTEEFPVEGLDSPNKTDRPDIVGYYPLGKKHERAVETN